MIWFWIILAVILSLIPLFNKKLDLASYMWLLLPIDAYGLSLAGATIKPYMVFALLLPLVLYAKGKGTDFDLRAQKSHLLLFIISILIITVNLVNTDDLSSFKAAFMTLVVYACAQLYVSCTNCRNSEQLSDVFIASCFGCSAVFILAYLCVKLSLNVGGVLALTREAPGMFMASNNMVEGVFTQTFRLRGFSIDPNTMFPQFIFGITACISKMFKKFKLYYLITLILSVFCVILSSSRMGLICVAIAIIITTTVGISRFESVKKKVLSVLMVLTACTLFLGFTITKYGQALMSKLFSTYSNRSSLTDEYGRFSIWEECFDIYWEKNPLWGVGFGKMDEYTSTSRMTHNTWLQLICECGMIVGTIVIIYFLTVLIIGWCKTSYVHKIAKDNTSYLSLIIGFTVTIVSLLSVDNLTCSYLWFSALLILKMAFSENLQTEPLAQITEQTPS